MDCEGVWSICYKDITGGPGMIMNMVFRFGLKLALKFTQKLSCMIRECYINDWQRVPNSNKITR